MWIGNFLRDQFASPSGLFGSLVVAPLLNVTNYGLIRASIEKMEAGEDDQILDIGFGGGSSLIALAERVPGGRIVGLDRSADMVSTAANLIAAKKPKKRVGLRLGSVEKMPFAAQSFDKALTVNTIYYWPNLARALKEIARVLKPGGRLAIGFHSPQSLWMFTPGWENFRRYQPQEVADAMRRAGFQHVRLAYQNLWRVPDDLVVVGERKRDARAGLVHSGSAEL